MATDHNGQINYLLHSCEIGNVNYVKDCIEKQNFDVNLSDEDGNTPLQVAAANDQVLSSNLPIFDQIFLPI